jgi:hypothetical protein
MENRKSDKGESFLWTRDGKPDNDLEQERRGTKEGDMDMQILKEKLTSELAARGLHLVWFPDPGRFTSADQLVVFGAEQAVDSGEEPLTAGFGPGGYSEAYGNSPISTIQDFHIRFLAALEAAGIPRTALHSDFTRVCRGKIWPTFVARVTQEVSRSMGLMS